MQDAGGHHRQHAAAVELLGQCVGAERQQQEDGHLDQGIRQLAQEPGTNHAESQTDPHPDDDGEDEQPEAVPDRHTAAEGGDQRDPIGGQRGRVVEQALAAQDGQDASRQLQRAGDGRRGHRIRRRDHRAQDQRQRPAELVAGHQVGHRADDHRGEQHQADRQQRNRTDIGPQVEVGAVQRGVEQQGRQHPEQHDVGVQLDVGDPRHEGQRQTGHHQHQRGRQVPPSGSGCDGNRSDH